MSFLYTVQVYERDGAGFHSGRAVREADHEECMLGKYNSTDQGNRDKADSSGGLSDLLEAIEFSFG